MKAGKKSGPDMRLVLFYPAVLMYFINLHTSFSLIPLYVIHNGGNEFSIGLQSTLFLVTGIVLRFYFGPLADIKGRKLTLLIGSFVFATTPLMLLAVQNHWMILPIRIYQGVGIATFLSSASSFLSDIAPREKRGAYIGMYRFTVALSMLTGPLCAQYLTNRYGFDTWFFTSSLIGLAGFLLIAAIKAPFVPKNIDFRPIDNIMTVLKNKNLRPVYFGIFIVCTSYGSILNFVTTYISQSTAVTNPGIYFTISGLFGIPAGLVAGHLSDRLGREKVVWPSIMILSAGTFILLFLPENPWVLYASCLLMGIGYPASLTSLTVWLVDRAEEKIRSTALSFLDSIFDSAVALSAFIIGASSQFISLAVSFGMVGSVVFAISFALMLALVTGANPQKQRST